MLYSTFRTSAANLHWFITWLALQVPLCSLNTKFHQSVAGRSRKMDLKLELSLKGDANDLKFQLAKDHRGPLFQSKETETMVILTAHIRGYMREQIKIDINKDGTVITIGGEKSTEEVIMVGWKVYKKGIEIMKFKKAFRIPDGVILDNIRANFNEDEYMLSILMPKKVKGIVGIGIEEMVEPELVLQDPETLPATSKKIKKMVTFKEESIRDPKQKIAEENGIESAEENQEQESGTMKKALEERDVADNKMTHNADLPCLASDEDRQVVQEQRTTHEIPRGDDKMSEEKLGKPEMKNTNQETPKPECNQICDQFESSQQKDQDQENNDQFHHEKESGIQEKEESALEKTEAQEGEQAKTEEPQKKSNIFVPLVAGGSAMLVSLVVFAIHATKTKNQQDKRKD